MRTMTGRLTAAVVLALAAAPVLAAPDSGTVQPAAPFAPAAALPAARRPPMQFPAVIPAAPAAAAPVAAVPAVPAPPAAAPAAPTAPAAPAVTAAPAAAAPAAPAESMTTARDGSPLPVVERFRIYSGPRTPAALIELFGEPVAREVRQLPEVVLTNGAEPISIEATVKAKAGTVPLFSVRGGEILSKEQAGSTGWLINLLPETGRAKAEFIITTGGKPAEYPLTIAAALPAGTDLSEKAFITFLADKTLKADLNEDGRRDYRDDFIFAANYLTALAKGAPDKPADDSGVTRRNYDQRPPAVDPAAAAAALADAAARAKASTPDAASQATAAQSAMSSGWASGGNSVTNNYTTATSGSGTTTTVQGAAAGTGQTTQTTQPTQTGGSSSTLTLPTGYKPPAAPTTTTTGSGAVQVTTITDGTTTVRYIGQDTKGLNLRNFKAKQNTLLYR